MYLGVLVGVGIGLIIGYLWRGRKMPAPIFEVGSSETEKMRREGAKAVGERIQRRKDRIIKAANKNGRITNDGVEDLFCISDRTAGNYLRDLVKEGRLEKVGTSGRGVYYVPKY